MSTPIVFISHFRIKGGDADTIRDLFRRTTARLETEKPRTALFLAYLDDGATRVSFVHGFADAGSMDVHFEGAGERAKAAYEYLEPEGWELYGSPSDVALETLRQSAASAGVHLHVHPEYVAGFLRLAHQ